MKGTGKYLRPSEVTFPSDQESKPVEASTGLPLVVEWEKMSKSKHNGTDPNEVLDKYGCDTTR